MTKGSSHSKKKSVNFHTFGPPILEKNFFADLHDLGHKRKKIKKCENDPILSRPPPKCEISHFFFFEWDLPLPSDGMKRWQ